MSTATSNSADVALPPGAKPASGWESGLADPVMYRLIEGPQRTITDSQIDVRVFATQLSDGRVDGGEVLGEVLGESPDIHIAGYVINSDQARELAAALLEAAAEADGWVTP